MSASPEDMEPRRSRSAQVNPMRNEPQTRAGRRAPAPAPPSGDGPGTRPPPPDAPPARAARPARARTAPAPGPRAPRRVRHTIKKVDLWSALKISLCFYVCEMAVLVTALAFLWLVADAFGVIGSVEKFVGDLLSSKDFKFLSAAMLRGTILVGLVLVAIQVVATVLACAFYNLFAELFGGIEVTVIQEDAPAGKR
jgi:Transmembrane domain of unknown function (DUF3566)